MAVSIVGLNAFLLSHLPAPPARVLEVGCGEGRQARALVEAGYDVLAIDTDPPAGSIFRRATIEELEEPGPFDAVVAARVLHHVSALDAAVDRIAELAPLLLMQDFGWDLLDEATSEWYEGQRRVLAAAGNELTAPSLADWEAHHADVHRFDVLRSAIARRFEERLLEWTPVLYRYLGGVTTRELERTLIAAGGIRPLGFRFVGVRRRR